MSNYIWPGNYFRIDFYVIAATIPLLSLAILKRGGSKYVGRNEMISQEYNNCVRV
jgi:hypothetical protein